MVIIFLLCDRRHQASRDDLAVFAALKNGVSAELVNASRWYKHIAALAGPRCVPLYRCCQVFDLNEKLTRSVLLFWYIH